MLTNEDIQKLIEVFATRDEVATKKDIEEMRKDFTELQTAVDAYAQKADTYFQEMVMLAHKVDPVRSLGQKNFFQNFSAMK